MINKPRVNDDPLWDIVFGMIGYPAVFVSYDLGIFEKLANEAMTLSELSEDMGIDERPMEALLSTNAALELLSFDNHKYKLTPLSEDYLLKKSPTFFGGVLDSVIQNKFAVSIDSLKQAVLTNSAQTYAEGDVFASHEEQAEMAKAFTLTMHSISVAPATYWPDTRDLSQSKTFLDIGGGSGAHTISVLQRWNNLSGIIFDIQTVCDVAQEFINKSSLQERAKVHSGDMWKSAFPEADIHFYSQIFHDWPPEKCRFLAQKSFDSLPVGGEIIIHENLYNDTKTGPFPASAASIAMLLWTEGRQYSGKELKDLLEEIGFKDISIKKGFGYFSTVRGVK